MSGERLKVVFCWHMHQPQYKDLIHGDYQLPWTYLHGIKDYVDMAHHLEAHPGARAVVNFAPVLLEQIDDYARQVRDFLREGRPIQDPLLDALDLPVLPVELESRIHIVESCLKNCLRLNKQRLVDRFPAFRELAEFSQWLQEHRESLYYVNQQFIADMLVWYHLAWLGESVRRGDGRVQGLLRKGKGFTLQDRRLLLEVIGELLGGIIPRYRRLAERGQIELAMSPYAHPILPLLIDIASAREAMPEVALPSKGQYPGGEERARWHIREGMATFERYFGFVPKGCWPSEGGVSEAALGLLEEHGFMWAASGQSVLSHSLGGVPSPHCGNGLYRAYRIKGQGIASFFRDDGLSDLIGFTYANWNPEDAVSDLVHHLENIAHACQGQPGSVVSIIMDGENAWEYYPENGYPFLDALYRRLSDHPLLEMTTFQDYLAQDVPLETLERLVAGSWVYGTFSTWIGDPQKNRGWELLIEAKEAFDSAMQGGHVGGEALCLAERQLAVCEGSDWFWWFGDYNPEEAVSDFERLFRLHLTNLYQLIGKAPPGDLTEAIAHGGGMPALGGVMRPGQS